MEPVECVDYKGYRIKIHQDDDAESPREWDCFGHMVCWHRNYNLGDKHEYGNPEDFQTSLAAEAQGKERCEVEDYLENTLWNRMKGDSFDARVKVYDQAKMDYLWKHINSTFVVLPLYLYDHSGITMSTGPFSCQWDSMRVGYYYVSKEEIRKEYGVKRIAKSILGKALALMEGEVRTYDDFLTGNVYGYEIVELLPSEDPEDEPEEGESLDSCWGFFGDYDKYMLDEAKSIVDHIAEKARQEEEREAQELAAELAAVTEVAVAEMHGMPYMSDGGLNEIH